mmetsp:Transcript_65477/g.122540  ORF Transcript_65477/g.122540 Transcript_65477/m.122540 type:complete len:256 (-) Transcript_65477:1804-2571(-)
MERGLLGPLLHVKEHLDHLLFVRRSFEAPHQHGNPLYVASLVLFSEYREHLERTSIVHSVLPAPTFDLPPEFPWYIRSWSRLHNFFFAFFRAAPFTRRFTALHLNFFFKSSHGSRTCHRLSLGNKSIHLGKSCSCLGGLRCCSLRSSRRLLCCCRRRLESILIYHMFDLSRRLLCDSTVLHLTFHHRPFAGWPACSPSGTHNSRFGLNCHRSWWRQRGRSRRHWPCLEHVSFFIHCNLFGIFFGLLQLLLRLLFR